MGPWNVAVYVRGSLLALVLVLTLAFPVPAALAADAPQSTSAVPPPVAGTSPATGPCMGRSDVAALDEYCGSLPDAANRRMPGPRLEHVLPKALVRQLKQAGPLGEVLLALPLATSPNTLGNRSRAKALDADDLLRSGRLGVKKDVSGSPLKVTLNTLTGGDMSVAFGSVLFVAAFGLGSTAWIRFRRRHTI
jgi:hypothetical protein